jgi:hypothetical protein
VIFTPLHPSINHLGGKTHTYHVHSKRRRRGRRNMPIKFEQRQQEDIDEQRGVVNSIAL